MKVETILRDKHSRVVTVRLNETVATAATLMKREQVGALVVKDVCRTEGNVVAGVFTLKDVANAVATHGAAALTMSVSALLNPAAPTCTPHDGIESVMRRMGEHGVSVLAVIDERHALMGTVSIGDIARHLLPQSEPSVVHA
jgi:CBS domain-containing protein